MAIATQPTERVRFDVEGMTCASCAARIERKLNKLDGVQATVNYATEEAAVAYDPDVVAIDDLLSAVEAAGYRPALPGEAEGPDAASSLRTRLVVAVAPAALPQHEGGSAMTGYGQDKDALIKRLHRIEGQVRGVERMIEEDRYCIDVLTQIAAVRTALEQVGAKLLGGHVNHCIEAAVASGDERSTNAKSAEMLKAVQRFVRTS